MSACESCWAIASARSLQTGEAQSVEYERALSEHNHCQTMNDAGEQCIYGAAHSIAYHRFQSEVEAGVMHPTQTEPEVWARTDERVAALKAFVNLARHTEFVWSRGAFREVEPGPFPTPKQVEAVMEMLRESELERAAQLRRQA